MNLDRFFGGIRARVDLTSENVQGFKKVIAYAQDRGTPLNQLAYILATALWETNFRMQPVTEAYWLSESWRRRNLRYYPWHGRGLIQTTWRRNYVTMGRVLGHDFTANPDDLLKWEWSLPALFVGMEQGLYTGKKLADYIDGLDESDAEDMREFRNARRIVNGTDKASTIGALALLFEKALRGADYSANEPLVLTEEDEEFPTLRLWSNNPAKVRELQTLLNKKGARPQLHVDGLFGPGTHKALVAYQQSIIEQGVVGKHTWAALLA